VNKLPYYGDKVNIDAGFGIILFVLCKWCCIYFMHQVDLGTIVAVVCRLGHGDNSSIDVQMAEKASHDSDSF
jgi:hypothetical protein